MKKVLYFLAVNLFVLTLVAQPARERKPMAETSKTTTSTKQAIGLQSDGCNYLMVSQPPKQKKVAQSSPASKNESSETEEEGYEDGGDVVD